MNQTTNEFAAVRARSGRRENHGRVPRDGRPGKGAIPSCDREDRQLGQV